MIIGVYGPQGSGKTLLSVLLSRKVIDFLDAYNEVIIYTNVNASGRNIKIIEDLGEIPLDRKPKILILDEAMFSVDSRRSSGESNVIWTRIVAFLRKTNFLMAFFNTHTPEMVDNRIRGQTVYTFMCRKSKKQFEYLILDMFSHQTKFITIPKSQDMYDYANFDTYDFPNPIDIELLIERNPKLFKVRTKKDRKAN